MSHDLGIGHDETGELQREVRSLRSQLAEAVKFAECVARGFLHITEITDAKVFLASFERR